MNRAVRMILLGLFFAACLLGSFDPTPARSLGRGMIRARPPETSEQSGAQKHELLFKIINSTLLAAALAILFRKPLAKFFAERSASVRKSLDEGRRALEASQAQLRAIEERLQRLDEEIAALKASAAREMEAERARLRQASAEEAERILASARAQLETSIRAAKLELKRHAAQQATELAEEMIRERLDDVSRQRLVSQFIAGLN